MSHLLRVHTGASLTALFALIAASPGLAQTAPVGIGPETVVITATRTITPLTDVPASVSVISQQQIADTPAEELDDVLRNVPGIDLLGYSADSQHPTSDSLGMRGLGGGAQGISRALVMVDGVPVNDPFFGYMQWNRVPLNDIDHVEIVRGGGSPLWGNYAEGGVINIITRTPTDNELDVDAGGGSYDTYRFSVLGAYRLDDNNILQGFVAANGTGGYEQVPVYERAPFNVPTSSDAVNLHLKDTITAADDLIVHLSLDYHDNHQRLETILDKNSQQNLNFTGDAAKQFADNATLTLLFFYGDSVFGTNNSTYFPDQSDLAATTQSLNEVHQVRAHDLGGSLIWLQQVTGFLKDYMVGADWHYISGDDHTDHYIAPDFTSTFFTTRGGGDQLFVAGFVQASIVPVDELEITASGRIQYVENTNGFDGSLGGLGAVPNREYTAFDPRVNVRYALPAGFALRGAWYESFRAPNIGDQFYTYAAGGFVQLPSPLLKPENLNGGEIGLDYAQPGLRSQVTLYRTNVNNYIVVEPTTNPIYSPNGWYVVQNQNVASVQAQGAEAEVNWDIGAGFSTNLDYTLADSVVKRNPLDPMSVGQQIVDVPRNKVAGSLTYAAPQGWRISVQALYVSRTDWASPDHTDPGYPGKISADPHAVFNLSGSYPVYRNMDVYVDIQNLLDRHYIATSFSAPSAQAYGTPFEIFGGFRIRA
jgi:outer membrane receptor protein involved in Fe transport